MSDVCSGAGGHCKKYSWKAVLARVNNSKILKESPKDMHETVLIINSESVGLAHPVNGVFLKFGLHPTPLLYTEFLGTVKLANTFRSATDHETCVFTKSKVYDSDIMRLQYVLRTVYAKAHRVID
jgi:hypothetical protein